MPTDPPVDEIDWTEIRKAQKQYYIKSLPAGLLAAFINFAVFPLLHACSASFGLSHISSFQLASVLVMLLIVPLMLRFQFMQRRIVPEAFTVCCPVCGVTWIKELPNPDQSTTLNGFVADEHTLLRQLFWFNCRNCKVPMFAKRVPNWLRERWKETKPDLSRSQFPGIASANDTLAHHADQNL